MPPPAAPASSAGQPSGPPPGPAGWIQRFRRLPRFVHVLAGAGLFLIAWYGILGGIQAGIAPDPALRPTQAQLPPGGSVAAGFAARLIDVEVNARSFTPNAPFFAPTALAARTAAYQARVVETVAPVVEALATPAAADAPIAEAAALLATPPDRWWLNAGWPPIRPTAERAYRQAIARLEQHNASLAARAAERSAGPALPPEAKAAIAALLAGIEAEAAAGDLLLRGEAEGSARIRLAAARGTAHAAAMLLRGLRDDHAAAVRMSGRAARWASAIDALDAVAATAPLFVSDRDLVKVGYHLLTAAAALRDILA